MKLQIFTLLFFIYIINAQIIDPYFLYSTMNIPYIYLNPYLQQYSTSCNNNNYTDSLNLTKYNMTDVYYISINTNFSYFKINIIECIPVAIYVQYKDIIEYSYDTNNWNKSLGTAFIYPMTGYLYVKITSIRNKISFAAQYMYYSSSINSTIKTDNINTSKTYIYNIIDNQFGIYVHPTTPGCQINNYLWYTTNISNLNLSYIFDSTFVVNNYYKIIYNITLIIVSNMDCDIEIFTTNTVYNYGCMTNVLYYNNSQVIDYLILNQTYDPHWNGTILLQGHLSTTNNFSFPTMSNLDVYNNMDKFIVPSGYFDSLLKYLGIYSPSNTISNITISNIIIFNTTINLDSNFTLSNDLLINNSILNINLTNIPISLDVQNSLIVLPSNNILITNISLTYNNTINVNGGIIISDNMNISGDLYITGNISTNDNLTLFKSNNINGKFDHVILNVDKCTNYTVDYQKNQILILFNPIDTCDKLLTNTNNDMMIYIIIGIILFLALIAIITIIIILKVKWCRQHVLPHRDRAVFRASTTITANKTNYTN